ncbi:hypothetical protein [Streptomyces sp. NPDC002952]|uniref:hypothetical protein n=1 Tax=Streptomyces sp. NPDC002952 TaxID=3364673 RepID=UPI00369E2631
MKSSVKKVLLSGVAAAAVTSVLAAGPAAAAESPVAKRESASMVASPLSYEYNYSLGWSFFYNPTSVMTAADTYFKDTFPFSSDCGAYTDLPPVTDPPVRCNLFFLEVVP